MMTRYEQPTFAGGIFFGVTLLMAAGCNSGDVLTADQKKQAHEALEAALKSWKVGEPPERWKVPSAKINVIDPDWEARFRLLDFTISRIEKKAGDQFPQGVVELSLEDTKGAKLKRQAVYVIKLGDQIVIARDPFS